MSRVLQGEMEGPGIKVGQGVSNNERVQTKIQNLCRLCAKKNKDLIPIFKGEGIEYQLKPKIDSHLPIKVHENDALPTQMCYDCASALLAWHELVENCLQAENKLNTLITHQNKNILESIKCDDSNSFAEDISGTDAEGEDENIVPIISENKSSCNTEYIDKSTQPVKKRLRSTEQNHDLSEEIFEKTVKEEQSKTRVDVSHDQETSDSIQANKKKRKKTEKNCMCTICGKVFKYVDNLKVHLTSHSDNRPHLCDICGSTFKRRSHVNHHKTTVHANHPDVRSRRGEKIEEPVTCEECGEVKKSKHAMYIHKKKHNKSYICDVCGKCFALPSILKAHMVLHSDEMPFSCDQCGKSFKLKVRLKVHKQSHTNYRPYACTICDNKRFKTKAALNVHNNMHNDTRPFPCPHCSWRARKNSDLICHIRTHTGEKPYKCEVCGRGFAQAGDMRKHRTTHVKYMNDHCYSNVH